MSAPAVDPIFDDSLRQHRQLTEWLSGQRDLLASIADALSNTLDSGGKILWCGNGGSAADAQHFAAELVGRFQLDRRGLASLALTTDSSILTSIANDYGYEIIFKRQVEALAKPGDLLVGISTSGNSKNVVLALQAARNLGLRTVGFTGEGGGQIAALVDHLFAVPSRTTARIQEMHLLAGHLLCDAVERRFATGRAGA